MKRYTQTFLHFLLLGINFSHTLCTARATLQFFLLGNEGDHQARVRASLTELWLEAHETRFLEMVMIDDI